MLNCWITRPLMPAKTTAAFPKACRPGLAGCGKTQMFFILSRVARRGISLFLGFKQREIPRFARNDKIKDFFFSSLLGMAQSRPGAMRESACLNLQFSSSELQKVVGPRTQGAFGTGCQVPTIPRFRKELEAAIGKEQVRSRKRACFKELCIMSQSGHFDA